MPAAERQQETVPCEPSPSAVGADNWPDTGWCPGSAWGADVGQVSLWRSDDDNA